MFLSLKEYFTVYSIRPRSLRNVESDDRSHTRLYFSDHTITKEITFHSILGCKPVQRYFELLNGTFAYFNFQVPEFCRQNDILIKEPSKMYVSLPPFFARCMIPQKMNLLPFPLYLVLSERTVITISLSERDSTHVRVKVA